MIEGRVHGGGVVVEAAGKGRWVSLVGDLARR